MKSVKEDGGEYPPSCCLTAEVFFERNLMTMAKNPAKKTAEAIKTEKAAAPAKAAAPVEAKPAPVKEAKPEVKAAPVKAAAKAAKKPAPAKEAKPAAKKPADKAAKAAPAEPRKKGGRKPRPVMIGDICAKLYKKIDKTKAAKIKDLVAADVEIWGWEDGTNKHLFVEVLDGKVRVEPYDYIDCTLKAHICFADAMAFLDGKLSLADALAAGKLNANGNVGAALRLAGIF